MVVLEMNENGHKWEKQNLVTINSSKGGYDLYVCAHCGIQGKSYTPGFIEIAEKYRNKAMGCPKCERGIVVRIVRCEAFGHEFKGLVPGSLHSVVPPPPGMDNKRGEWVMGATEPVLLLFREFNYVD